MSTALRTLSLSLVWSEYGGGARVFVVFGSIDRNCTQEQPKQLHALFLLLLLHVCRY